MKLDGRMFDTAAASVTAMKAALNLGETDIASLSADLALKAPLASPALTGTPTAPTAAALTNTTALSTTAYADAAVAVEKSRALAAEALKAPLASPALTGTPTAPTASALTNTTQLASTAYTDAAVAVEASRATAAEALKAPLASPAFTGAPTLPTGAIGITQAALNNSTALATTAYSDASSAAAALPKAPLASPTFTGAPSLPTGSIGITQAALNNSTALATTAYADNAAGVVALQADAETGTDNVKKMTALRTSQEIVNRPTSFKNLIQNGGLEVWQRGTSIAVAASTTAYTADGWYLKTGASQAFTVSRVAGLVAQSQYAAQVQRTAGQTGATAVYFAVALDSDDLFRLRSGAAVLSFTVSTGANWSPASGTLSYNLYCGTGAVSKRNSVALTAETNPITGSTNLTVSNAATRIVSAVSAAIGAAITQAELQVSWTPTGTAGANDWLAIDDVQTELVPVGVTPVTPVFERIDTARDILRCMRVVQTGVVFSQLYGIGTSGIQIHRPLVVPMRATPTMTVLSTTGTVNLTSMGLQSIDNQTISIATATAITATGNYTAAATYLVSAEI